MKWDTSALTALPRAIKGVVINASLETLILMLLFHGLETDRKVATKNIILSNHSINITIIIEMIISHRETALHWDLDDTFAIVCCTAFTSLCFKERHFCAVGRTQQCWCKTCISSCNCSSYKSSANHRSFTCLDGFTRKFSLYNSQMFTIVQQLWHSLKAITVWSQY